MTYEWRCKCGATIEVTRRMSDSEVGPRESCPRCKGTSFKKMVSMPGKAVNARSENSPFPMRIRHLERPTHIKNAEGAIVGIERKPVVFQNEHEYNTYLNARGLVKMCDGEDPMVGDSQHSVYDQREGSAPNARAAALAERAHFVESPDSVTFA